MRILGVLSTCALFLCLIASSPGYAQQRQNDKPQVPDASKPQAQEEQKPKDNDRMKDQEKAQTKEDKKAQKEEEKNAKREEKRQQDEMNAGRQENRQHPEANRPEDKQQREQHQASNRPDMARNDHRGGGRHIPDDQFRAHFGRQHTFHVQRTQIVNVSQPVIVYGGYSFQLVETWPAEWSYDDDCYIDYVDDQYYLFDVLHPGIRIAVIVVS